MTQEASNLYTKGWNYYHGKHDIPMDRSRALECFQKAAELDDARAMNYLGLMYEDGDIVEQNYRIAVDWYYRSIKSDSGNANAAYNLGRMYFFGTGVEEDLDKAYQFFECVLGLLGVENKAKIVPWSCYYMGCILAKRNKLEESIKYFVGAADNGNIPGAWYNLGVVVENGAGPIKGTDSKAKAKRDGLARGFYENAAKLGHTDAMAAVGRLYIAYGMYDEGMAWLKKAESMGSEVAKKLLEKSNSKGCYIATAVYGSYECPEVWTLRRFRDYSLSQTWYGRAFIKIYYSVSPTLVKLFGKSDWFIGFCKPKLDNMVNKLIAKGFESTPYKDKQW